MKLYRNFQRGGEVSEKIPFRGGGMSIFWNYTIFEISALDVVTYYTIIIMSRTLKATGNHVKLTHFVLLPVSEEAKA